MMDYVIINLVLLFRLYFIVSQPVLLLIFIWSLNHAMPSAGYRCRSGSIVRRYRQTLADGRRRQTTADNTTRCCRCIVVLSTVDSYRITLGMACFLCKQAHLVRSETLHGHCTASNEHTWSVQNLMMAHCWERRTITHDHLMLFVPV